MIRLDKHFGSTMTRMSHLWSMHSAILLQEMLYVYEDGNTVAVDL